MNTRRWRNWISFGVLILSLTIQAQNPEPWFAKPLSLADCLDLATRHNAAILKSARDLEATQGITVQARAVALPKVRLSAEFVQTDRNAVDTFPFINVNGDQRWNAGVQVVQSIYEGGRMKAAIRAARLTREQSLLQHQVIVADVVAAVRVAYYATLMAAQHIVVQEASVKLLMQELEDQQRRQAAGTVPRFNVLRAEVEVGNARPRLIRARNALRIAKSNLANLLGQSVPASALEDLPIQLAGTLESSPFDLSLEAAIGTALEKRQELAALSKARRVREEGIVNARAGSKPGLSVFAGYGSRSSMFSDDLTMDRTGWNTGAQLRWDIFDGHLTRGKVEEARALSEKTGVELDDARRRIEHEVRTAYSNFTEAREVLASQAKVQEQADEALRLAIVRSETGTGTQLDVLNAQTALTEARSTQIQAQHDLAVAVARLERAVGR